VALTLAKDRYQNFKLFWESYLPTIEFKITGPIGTIFWILSGIVWSKLALIALGIHVVPIIHHYARNRPFGIDVSFVPTQYPDGSPDLISADEGEAVLDDGTCAIVAKVSLSKSLSSFALQFESADNIIVELRDIPKPEHVYRKKENILLAKNISSHRFQVVIDVFNDNRNSIDREYLKIIDYETGTTITQIELI
jgi:hypothetical protein